MITGYPECVEAMKAAIEEIVKDLESHIVQDVLISAKVHPVSVFAMPTWSYELASFTICIYFKRVSATYWKQGKQHYEAKARIWSRNYGNYFIVMT